MLSGLVEHQHATERGEPLHEGLELGRGPNTSTWLTNDLAHQVFGDRRMIPLEVSGTALATDLSASYDG